jgi:hypothetical protein
MENIREHVIIKNKNDNQKLIHIFVKLLDISLSKYNYTEIVNLLYKETKIKFKIEEIIRYFEPNLQEEITDINLQLKNLNL